ncbi:MAG: hypothetical protein WCI34_00710, partial [Actinomycetes bacterium]
LFDLASLALAMLAAGGATRITSAIGERSGGRRSAAVATLLTVLVCLEGAAFVYPHPIVPDPPRALAALGGPRIEIPSRELDNDLYTLWSVDGFPKIVNGSSAFSLLVLHRAQRDAGHVPAAGSVYRLRALGVRFVVVHLDRLNPGLRAAYTDAKPLPHVLGVRRRRVGDMVVFDLGTRHQTRLPPLAARHEG